MSLSRLKRGTVSKVSTMLCKVCCSARHKLDLARISCGLWVSIDALGMMTFEPRDLTSIAQLPKLICREWSFSRLTVSARSASCLHASLTAACRSACIPRATASPPSPPRGGTTTVNTPMAIYPAVVLGSVAPAITEAP